MPTTTISGKGQVTIPAAILRQQQLHPGDRLEVIALADGLALVRRPDSLTDAIAGAAAGVYDEGYVDSERDTWS